MYFYAFNSIAQGSCIFFPVISNDKQSGKQGLCKDEFHLSASELWTRTKSRELSSDITQAPPTPSSKAPYKPSANAALSFLSSKPMREEKVENQRKKGTQLKNMNTLLHKVPPKYSKVSAFWGRCYWCFNCLTVLNTGVHSGNDVLMLQKLDSTHPAQTQSYQGIPLNRELKSTEQTLKAAKGRTNQTQMQKTRTSALSNRPSTLTLYYTWKFPKTKNNCRIRLINLVLQYWPDNTRNNTCSHVILLHCRLAATL